MELRADWAEEAVMAAVCARQKRLGSVAKARRDSHARQKAGEAESDRHREVEKRAQCLRHHNTHRQ